MCVCVRARLWLFLLVVVLVGFVVVVVVVVVLFVCCCCFWRVTICLLIMIFSVLWRMLNAHCRSASEEEDEAEKTSQARVFLAVHVEGRQAGSGNQDRTDEL